MNMTLIEIKFITSTCWSEKYQPLTIDMTKNKNTGRYILGLNSLFVPESYLFYINKMSIYPNVTEQGLDNFFKLAEQQKNQRALNLKKKKQTHDVKLAENLSSLTEKVTEVNESTKKVEVLKPKPENETPQLATKILKTIHIQVCYMMYHEKIHYQT